MFPQALSEDILCADSFWGFKDSFPNDQPVPSKLIDIYRKYFDRELAGTAGTTEKYVLMMLHVALACKDIFFRWCDVNYKQFNSFAQN